MARKRPTPAQRNRMPAEKRRYWEDRARKDAEPRLNKMWFIQLHAAREYMVASNGKIVRRNA